MKNLCFLSSILLLILVFSCQKEIQKEGYVKVVGGKIWYKIIGEKKGIPLLIIHGGPGSRSCEMIPGYSLLSNERPIIFYDQLGSGNSDRPSDTSLWHLNRFVDEIDSIRSALKLTEVHILGHSWGSTILIEYLIKKNPVGVKSVIFSSPVLSSSIYVKDARLLLSNMSAGIKDTIEKYEKLKKYTANAYLEATDSFYSEHISLKYWPYIETADCKNVRSFNEEVYNHMWGPTEFTTTGNLKNFDRTLELGKITQPILFIAGEYDIARPETVYRFQKIAHNAHAEIIQGAAHWTYIDQPKKVAKTIGKFLTNVEKD